MTLVKRGPHGLTRTRSLLNSLIELPDLARTIQALPAQTFASLVRKVGVEDAGELVALATTEQLVQAFDEDLFVSDRAGERESLDVGRFVVWLEVLLEAGDEVAADRGAELDEDFVAHALGGVILVIEEDALRERLDDGDEDEATQVVAFLFEAFARTARERGATPVLALLPSLAGDDPSVFAPLPGWAQTALRETDPALVRFDLHDEFAAVPVAERRALFLSGPLSRGAGAHYSPAGNALVARALARRLEAAGLLAPDACAPPRS